MQAKLSRETHKSLATNALVALIGGLFALALGLQCGWGAWGLVATILPASLTGWVLADWRGFQTACKKAWGNHKCNMRSIVSVSTDLSVDIITITSALATLLADMIIVVSLLDALMVGEDWWTKNLPNPSSKFWPLAILCCLAGLILGWLARKTGKINKRGEIKALGTFILLANPLTLSFTLIYGAWQTAVRLWGMTVSIYLYANSDQRRIAFASIALGMSLGCAVGLHLKAVLLGSVLCGALAWCLGYAQHRFIYQRLTRQTVEVAR